MKRIIISLCVTPVLLFNVGCFHVYQSIGKNFGAYISTVKGKEFQQVGNRWDYESKALLYVYRPDSQWASDEVEAPTFYLDNERIFNIRANGYTWFELEPGEYDVIMRRPLLGIEGIDFDGETFFEFGRIAEMNLSVEADKVYFLRYNEIDPPAQEHQILDEDVPMGDGPLMLVATDLAHEELAATRMLPEGGHFIKYSGPLSTKNMEEVFDSRVIDLEEVPVEVIEPEPEEEPEDTNTMKWWW